jgi:pimeloyl-ACP methyl ester carboxylesterase
MRSHYSQISKRCKQAIADQMVATANAKDPKSEYRLLETPAWLSNNKGPSAAKGVVYFIYGNSKSHEIIDGFSLDPYFVNSLSEAGWDVIIAKPSYATQSLQNAPEFAVRARNASTFVKRRVTELRRSGYRHVVLAGHSWGGWIALAAAQDSHLGADAVILSSPAIGGTRISRFTGDLNPFYHWSLDRYVPLMKALRIPTVLTVFRGDDYEIGERGQIAEKDLTSNGVPHLVIDKPAGFTGHFAAWLPVFDFEFGGCISAFLDSLRSQGCERRQLNSTDFRSIINISQLAKPDRISSPDALVGRQFVVYARGAPSRKVDYISATERSDLSSDGLTNKEYSFRNDLHCVAKDCEVLAKWSDGHLLAFDPQSGDVKGWWVGVRAAAGEPASAQPDHRRQTILDKSTLLIREAYNADDRFCRHRVPKLHLPSQQLGVGRGCRHR